MRGGPRGRAGAWGSSEARSWGSAGHPGGGPGAGPRARSKSRDASFRCGAPAARGLAGAASEAREGGGVPLGEHAHYDIGAASDLVAHELEERLLSGLVPFQFYLTAPAGEIVLAWSNPSIFLVNQENYLWSPPPNTECGPESFFIQRVNNLPLHGDFSLQPAIYEILFYPPLCLLGPNL